MTEADRAVLTLKSQRQRLSGEQKKIEGEIAAQREVVRSFLRARQKDRAAAVLAVIHRRQEHLVTIERSKARVSSARISLPWSEVPTRGRPPTDRGLPKRHCQCATDGGDDKAHRGGQRGFTVGHQEMPLCPNAPDTNSPSLPTQTAGGSCQPCQRSEFSGFRRTAKTSRCS